MTPRRNARRMARELKHAPPVFDLDDESPWPLPEPVCDHRWVATQEGQTYADLRCTKCGETKRETWD